mmetsp:Transcript_21828/g.60641  ORF Transcript_21828/g.60641 Transcript_21828/m.60641 type:complete len:147 (-) Transcript_21828:11-451(-)
MARVKLIDPSDRFKAPPITVRSLPKAKVQQVNAIFLMLDTDRDALLTWEQIQHGGQLLGLRLEKEPSEYDVSPPDINSGFEFEDFAGFVAAAIHRDHNAVDDMKYETGRLFSAVDRFGQGSVTAANLSKLFDTFGDRVSGVRVLCC